MYRMLGEVDNEMQERAGHQCVWMIGSHGQKYLNHEQGRHVQVLARARCSGAQGQRARPMRRANIHPAPSPRRSRLRRSGGSPWGSRVLGHSASTLSVAEWHLLPSWTRCSNPSSDSEAIYRSNARCLEGALFGARTPSARPAVHRARRPHPSKCFDTCVRVVCCRFSSRICRPCHFIKGGSEAAELQGAEGEKGEHVCLLIAVRHKC